jgi:hypothetical protein
VGEIRGLVEGMGDMEGVAGGEGVSFLVALCMPFFGGVTEGDLFTGDFLPLVLGGEDRLLLLLFNNGDRGVAGGDRHNLGISFEVLASSGNDSSTESSAVPLG